MIFGCIADRILNEAKYVRRQYVAEDASAGQILGFGSIEQSIYLPKYRLFIVTDPRWLKLWCRRSSN